MKAIGWLLIFIGIGAGIDAYHGNSPYQSLISYLEGNGATKSGSTAQGGIAGGVTGAAQGAANGIAGSGGGVLGPTG